MSVSPWATSLSTSTSRRVRPSRSSAEGTLDGAAAGQTRNLAALLAYEWPLLAFAILGSVKRVTNTIAEIAEGRVAMELDPAEFHYNPLASVHGGIVATLLDSVMGCAVHSKLPRGRGYTTVEIKVNYVRPMKRETGRVQAIAKVVHLGGKIATAEGSIVDGAGTRPPPRRAC